MTPKKPAGPRILLFDIESTGLKADWSKILCAAWKWHDPTRITKKTEFVSLWDDPNFYTVPKLDDEKIVRALHAEMSKATHIVAHYGKRFDIPFMNTKFWLLGLPMITTPEYRFQDTCEIAWKKLLLSSNRLGNIANIKNTLQKGRSALSERYNWKLEKDKAGFGVWNRITHDRNKEDTKIMERYNRNDVLVLENIYVDFKPLFNDSGYASYAKTKEKAIYTCNSCGNFPMQKHSTRPMPGGGGRYHRLYCTVCGATKKGDKVGRE